MLPLYLVVLFCCLIISPQLTLVSLTILAIVLILIIPNAPIDEDHD